MVIASVYKIGIKKEYFQKLNYSKIKLELYGQHIFSQVYYIRI